MYRNQKRIPLMLLTMQSEDPGALKIFAEVFGGWRADMIFMFTGRL